MIRAIIFDFFGVIVGNGFENTYRAAGGDPYADKDFINEMLDKANLGQIDEDGFNQAMSKKLGIVAKQWLGIIADADKPDLQLLEYVEEVHQNFKTAILSNSNLGVIYERIGDIKLDKYFDEVVVSAEIGLVKPDPEIYKHTAEKLDLETSECIFIDDRKPFVDAATNIGMQGILYKGLASLKEQISCLTNLKD
jgi:putative hydrolase of the HAD superfamily